jgi:hypothetical protein
MDEIMEVELEVEMEFFRSAKLEKMMDPKDGCQVKLPSSRR